MFTMPATRAAFWRAKITGNTARDQAAHARLREDNWRVLTVWECALRGPARRPVKIVVDAILEWLDREEPEATIQGEPGPQPAGKKR
jgi:DNA mismatch endonuclease (patch repair protein)